MKGKSISKGFRFGPGNKYASPKWRAENNVVGRKFRKKTPEEKLIIEEKRRAGLVARNLSNNPMKNPESRKKASEKLKGENSINKTPEMRLKFKLARQRLKKEGKLKTLFIKGGDHPMKLTKNRMKRRADSLRQKRRNGKFVKNEKEVEDEENNIISTAAITADN